MNDLYNYIDRYYRRDEFPALAEQISIWSETRPFDGVKILDATPVFRNTLVKYLALLSGGAEITVAIGDKIPADYKIFDMLPDFSIRQATKENLLESYDIIADCAGSFHILKPRRGFVELTRSGLEYYRDSAYPVFSADSGLLKKLETVSGTGDGFIRALKHSGFTDLSGRNILLFGCGKVGYGIASGALRENCSVTVVDKSTPLLPPGAALINAADKAAVTEAVNNAWCVVSATGLPGALAEYASVLNSSNAIIANMGVEDEFGPELPETRVLNNKRPFNFILEEPTQIRYIDATMALDNYGIEMLLKNDFPSGISFPPEELENKIIKTVSDAGLIADEAAEIIKLHKQQDLWI